MILGRSILASDALGDNRVFVYEVAGLRQSDQTDRDNSVIRKSSTVMMPVAFNRMSEFMQRMNRLGATIVSIHSLNNSAPQQKIANPSEE
jgi:phycocyanin-associated, rod